MVGSLVYEVALSGWLAVAAGLFGARRGLPIAAAVGLVMLCGRMVWQPGYGMSRPEEMLPSWQTLFLSAANVPFLLGVLIEPVRERGHTLRWVVLALLGVTLIFVPGRFDSLEGQWCAYSLASAIVVWLALQFQPVSPTNVLVRAGDWSYGLYLVHVPLIRFGFALWLTQNLVPNPLVGMIVTGAAAMILGLLFGRLESRLHARLRVFTKNRCSFVPVIPLTIRNRLRLP
jgi:peptidoglycan/LPS O-acetylase OafA/YrhL